MPKAFHVCYISLRQIGPLFEAVGDEPISVDIIELLENVMKNGDFVMICAVAFDDSMMEGSEVAVRFRWIEFCSCIGLIVSDRHE